MAHSWRHFRKRMYSLTELLMFFCAFGALVFVFAQIAPQLRSLLSPPVVKVLLSGKLVHVDPEEVYSTFIGLEKLDFFHMDLRHMKERVETLPWVHAASIEKIWPQTLRIKIIERTVVSRWGEGKLLARSGIVYESESFDSSVLPVLRATRGREEFLLSVYEKFSGRLSQCGMQVRGLEEDGYGSLNLLLVNGALVLFGHYAPEERMRRFLNVCAVAPKALFVHAARMDFRHSYGFAVTWKEGLDGVMKEIFRSGIQAVYGA